MQLILQALSMLGIYAAVAIFRYKTEYNYAFDMNCSHIKMNKSYLIVGILLSIFMLGLSTWVFFDGLDELSLILFIFAVLSSSLIFAYFGFRIDFDDEKLTYRKFFEARKTILYKDITSAEIGLDITIKTKENKLVIPNYMTNTPALLLKMMPYLPKREKSKAKNVPRVRRFVDSIERPYEYIVLFWIIEILLIGLLIGCLIAKAVVASINDPAFVLICFLIVFFFAFGWVSAHAVKRAHASTFWNKVAKKLFREYVLKD